MGLEKQSNIFECVKLKVDIDNFLTKICSQSSRNSCQQIPYFDILMQMALFFSLIVKMDEGCLLLVNSKNNMYVFFVKN